MGAPNGRGPLVFELTLPNERYATGNKAYFERTKARKISEDKRGTCKLVRQRKNLQGNTDSSGDSR
jgi:hypothetical protein